MIRRLLVLLPLVFAAAAQAQERPATGAAQREAMARLSFLVGQFRGTGWITLGPRGVAHFEQTEQVRMGAGGTVLVIDGRGVSTDTGAINGQVIHDAFATIYWNEAKRAYVFRSHTANGGAQETWARVTPDTLVWGFESGGANITFTIAVTDGLWHEVGDRVAPDGTKTRFFEMRVRRQ